MAKGKIWKMDVIEEMNVHKTHLFLAHKIDKMKMKASVMNNNSNTIQL